MSEIHQFKCFDPEAHRKFLDELTKDCFEMMSRGICPICLLKIQRHSKLKCQICQKMLQKKLKIRNYMMIDGKLMEVTARPATPEELRQ